jgi:hypothetical protein
MLARIPKKIFQGQEETSTMISLRSFFTAAVVAVASLSLAACQDNNPVAPSSKIAPSGASFDGKVGNVGNSAKNGDIDVRVIFDKSGNALLTIRTGSYDPKTNIATPNGYFQQIQYKIYDASGKQQQVKTVKFSKTGVDTYSTYINLCSTTSDDDDDDDSGYSSSCSKHYAFNWTVSVQANLKGVGGDDKKTDVVREDGQNGYLPDLDISTQNLSLTLSGTTSNVSTSSSSPTGVPALAPVTFSVPFPNNKPINGAPNTFAVTATCLVFVDNILQIAPITNPFPPHNVIMNGNAFDYVNGATHTISAGTTGSCQFTLALPAGPHKIAVSALVTAPGDYDITNNTTTFFYVNGSSGPPDVQALGGLKTLSGSTYSDIANTTLIDGQTVTVYQQISQVALTNPGAVTCAFTVDGVAKGTSTVSPGLNGVASSGYCKMDLTFTTGAHTIVVTASTAGETATANNSATTSVNVANGAPSGAISALLSGPATMASGATVAFTAPVSVTSLVNLTSLAVKCRVTVDNMELRAGTNHSIGTSTVKLTWPADSSVNVAPGSPASCAFSLTITESGNSDVVHKVVVTAVPSVGAIATVSTPVANITTQVRVDLQGTALKQFVGGSWVDPSPLTMGSTGTFGVQFYNPDATRTLTIASCPILGDAVSNASTSGFVSGITSNIQIAPHGFGYCTFSVTPNTLQALGISATATLAAGSPIDPNTANNTFTGTLSVKSNGKFSSFDPQNTNAFQEWYNDAGTPNFPVQLLTKQAVQVTRLALLVVPTGGGDLGSYTLSGFVVNNDGVNSGKTFPTGTVTGRLNAAAPDAGTSCQIVAPPGTAFANPPSGMPAAYNYAASICTEQFTLNGNPNFQQITVNYTQSVQTNQERDPVANPQMWALQPGFVDVNLRLDFALPGATADFVAGKIHIPLGTPYDDGSSNNGPGAGNYVGKTFRFFLPGAGASIAP